MADRILAAALSILLIAAQALAQAPPQAPPQAVDPQVVSGTASFQQSGESWTITTSHQAIIDWQQFSIPQGSTMQFIQPSASSLVTNRVIGPSASYINGMLLANGRVLLINPNGIHIGLTGQIQVHGLIASTLDLSNSQILQGGNLNFVGGSMAKIENAGTIEAIGGDIYLIANSVANTGALSAPAGTVGLAAGNNVLLTQDGKLFVMPADGAIQTDRIGIDNQGLIESVKAEMKTRDGNVYALAINSGGIVRAGGMVRDTDGEIVLRADGGTVVHSGVLAAKTTDADGKTTGGRVQVLGNEIALRDGSVIDVSGDRGGGKVNVGGSYQGEGPLPNAENVIVSAGASIRADAVETGNGGEVILWADDTMAFGGHVSALGGPSGGDGGFVEVSGGESLIFRGDVDAGAPLGGPGMLLLDPRHIYIVDDPGGAPHDNQLNDGEILADDGLPPPDFTISRQKLESLGGNMNVLLEAKRDIIINDMPGDAITFPAGTGTITFTADDDMNGIGDVEMLDLNDAIVTNGRALTMWGNDLILGRLNTSSTVGPGGEVGLAALNQMTVESIDASGTSLGPGIDMHAHERIVVNGPIDGNQALTADTINKSILFNGPLGASQALASVTSMPAPGYRTRLGADVTCTGTQTYFGRVRLNADVVLTGNEINFGPFNGNGNNLTLQPFTAGRPIVIGDTVQDAGSLNISADEVNLLKDGFGSVTVGAADGTSPILIHPDGIEIRDPWTIRSPAGTGIILAVGTIVGDTNDASVTLLANRLILTNGIRTEGMPISITSTLGSILNWAGLRSKGGPISLVAPNGRIWTYGLLSTGIGTGGVLNVIGTAVFRRLPILGQGDLTIVSSGLVDHFENPLLSLLLWRRQGEIILPMGPGPFNPLPPSQGDWHLGVMPTPQSVPKDDLENFLWLPPGSFDAINPNVDEGQAARVFIVARGGDVLTLNSEFVHGYGGAPFVPPDFAFVSLAYPGGGWVTQLGDVASGTTALPGGFGPSGGVAPANGVNGVLPGDICHTGYQTYRVTLPQTSVYLVGIGAMRSALPSGSAVVAVPMRPLSFAFFDNIWVLPPGVEPPAALGMPTFYDTAGRTRRFYHHLNALNLTSPGERKRGVLEGQTGPLANIIQMLNAYFDALLRHNENTTFYTP